MKAATIRWDFPQDHADEDSLAARGSVPPWVIHSGAE